MKVFQTAIHNCKNYTVEYKYKKKRFNCKKKPIKNISSRNKI